MQTQPCQRQALKSAYNLGLLQMLAARRGKRWPSALRRQGGRRRGIMRAAGSWQLSAPPDRPPVLSLTILIGAGGWRATCGHACWIFFCRRAWVLFRSIRGQGFNGVTAAEDQTPLEAELGCGRRHIHVRRESSVVNRVAKMKSKRH